MAARRHALVIGGSLGGLFAANLLRAIGWDATVFERSKVALASRGAGLGTTRELVGLMRRAGARLDISMAVEMNAYVWIDAAGRILHTQERVTASSTWSRVYQPLRLALPDTHYRPGMSLERVEPAADGVTAIFADGSRARGDILIAADGNQSTVRRQLLPGVEPRYAGYVAWRGIMEERDVPAAIHRDLFDKMAFSFAEGEMSLAMPVPGHGDDTRPGHRRYYFIWYRPTGPDKLRALYTDAEGAHHPNGIPPPLIRGAFVEEIKARAETLFAPPLAAVIGQTQQPLLQAISDFESPRLALGRVALLGDAAFVARPHVAAGVTKAAMDAGALADALAAQGDIDAALALYAERQHRFGTEIVAHGRRLGTYLSPPTAASGPDEAYRDPRRVMRDYGAPSLVHDLSARDLAAAQAG
ncbi:MAG: FAD-dependent monooxygenase [Rhodospirillaceae bacterium]|nr:FAD-dependent monooxygenase [Rhodospirillaceae bacterium]